VTRIAILDDYIGVALEYGDWNALPPDAEVTVYREAIPPERLIEELVDYEIVVITRQRARFPRAVLQGLPKLKLLVCNGRTSNVIDHQARIERGILLAGGRPKWLAEGSRASQAVRLSGRRRGAASAPQRTRSCAMASVRLFVLISGRGSDRRIVAGGLPNELRSTRSTSTS
jgi:D-isomer specific 2-hydroxyacid dehydrogenase, catalytic domain